jgi:signal peptidase II
VRPRPAASTSFLIAVTTLSLAADLATKAWAKGHLDPKAHGVRKLEIVKGHIDFIFAQNPGGAWSFLRSLPDSLRRPFFLVVSAAAIVFIITIYQRVHRDQVTMKWGLPLALGGAMGNLADRIRYGWVVDFIDASMKWGGREHHWPTFNVADIAIVIGVGLMAIDMLRSRGLHPHEQPGFGAVTGPNSSRSGGQPPEAPQGFELANAPPNPSGGVEGLRP